MAEERVDCDGVDAAEEEPRGDMARGDGSGRSKRKKKSRDMCLFYRAINEDQQGSNISSKEVEAEVTLTGRMNLRTNGTDLDLIC